MSPTVSGKGSRGCRGPFSFVRKGTLVEVVDFVRIGAILILWLVILRLAAAKFAGSPIGDALAFVA